MTPAQVVTWRGSGPLCWQGIRCASSARRGADSEKDCRQLPSPPSAMPTHLSEGPDDVLLLMLHGSDTSLQGNYLGAGDAGLGPRRGRQLAPLKRHGEERTAKEAK
jgi:hypothetical protein